MHNRSVIRFLIRMLMGALFLLLCIPITNPTHAQGTFIPAAARVDMVYDDARGIVYITNGAEVLRYRLATGDFLTPYSLGGSLMGIDISPDGNTLAVADTTRSDTEVWIHLIDLTTDTSRKIAFPRGFYEGGTFTVAYGLDNAILVTSRFEGSGWVPLRRYDPATNATTTVNSVRQDTMLAASADRTVIAYAESNISNGAWGTYRVISQTIAGGGATGWFDYEIGVQRGGEQYALPTYGGTFIYDAAFAGITTLGTYAGPQPIGVAYHPTENRVYLAWAGTTQVRAYDTTTFALVASYDTEYIFTHPGNHAFVHGRLKTSADGRLIFVTVGGGVRVIDTTAPPPTLTPSPTITMTRTPAPTFTITPMPTQTSTPPPLPDYSVSINNGALYARQIEVILTLSARPGTTHMQISNDGGFAGSIWEPYTPSRNWQITHYWSYVIPRIVYVRFKDSNGIIWGTYQDDIILDEISPHGNCWWSLETSSTPIATIVHCEATDDVSGLGEMRLSREPEFNAATWEPYSTARPWVFGDSHVVYIQFRDNAGNISTINELQYWSLFLPIVISRD